MQYKWKTHKRDWIEYATERKTRPGLVKTTKTPQGYIWSCGKVYGYETTLDAAKQWAETIAEQYTVSANMRSITGLGR